VNLALDIGNTRFKAGLFSGNQLVKTEVSDNLKSLLNFCRNSKGTITHTIVGSVTQDHLNIIEALGAISEVLLFESHTAIPIENLYQSSSTLGSDRLAASIAANALYPSQNLLVVDCGTCIKYNFVNAKNKFVGGAISPGLAMRFKALNHYTSKLPLLESNLSFTGITGKNTNESIWSGVQNGWLKEIEAVIAEYESKFPGIKVIATGGDAPFLEKGIKKSIFADPYLLLKGLNIILNFNVNK
jgi:type III pantothenate kinase